MSRTRQSEHQANALEDGIALGYAEGRKEGIEEAIEVIARWLESRSMIGSIQAEAIRAGEPWSSS